MNMIQFAFHSNRKLSDGLFLEVSREMAKEYPEIEHNDMIVDNCCMQLVSNPRNAKYNSSLMIIMSGTNSKSWIWI